MIYTIGRSGKSACRTSRLEVKYNDIENNIVNPREVFT
jgi:hypothetical protein